MPQTPPAVRLFRGLIDLNRVLRTQSSAWVGGEHGLSRNEVIVLGLIKDEGGCRASHLSERMSVGASVVSRLVSGLADRGLLTRETDPDDGRAELLHVTATGRDATRLARKEFVRTLSEHLADWDDDRIEAAAVLLEDLTKALRPATPR